MIKKVKISLLLLVLVAPLFVTGCLTANLGPKFTQAVTPVQGKAVIYVYRQRGVMTATTMPGVIANEAELVGSLPEISYFSLSVDPGQYTFTPKLLGIYKTIEAVVDAEAGQVYYVRLKVSMGTIEFTHMDKDEAMAYMATCYQLDPKYYRDPRVSSKQPASGTAVTVAPARDIHEPVAVATVEKKEVPVQSLNKAAEPVKPEIKEDPRGRLFVDVTPSDAKVRIMNISPAFKQGIALNAGRYDVEISAPGYKSHREWASLEQGEEKHLNIVLPPEKTQVVASAPEKTVVKEPAATPVVKTVKKADIPAGISAEENRYAEMLQSGNVNDLRNAAKNIYYRYYSSDYLTGLAEQALLKNYSNEPSNLQIDAMAWLCKVLGRTGDKRFSETLKTVAENAPHRKLKGHAEKSLNQL